MESRSAGRTVLLQKLMLLQNPPQGLSGVCAQAQRMRPHPAHSGSYAHLHQPHLQGQPQVRGPLVPCRQNPGSDFTAPALNQPSGGLRAGAVGVRERPSADPVVKRPLAAQQNRTLCGGNYSHLASLTAPVNRSTETLPLFPAKGVPTALPWGPDSSTAGTGNPPLLSQPPFLRRPLPRLSLEAQREASPSCQGNGSIVSTAGV